MPLHVQISGFTPDSKVSVNVALAHVRAALEPVVAGCELVVSDTAIMLENLVEPIVSRHERISGGLWNGVQCLLQLRWELAQVGHILCRAAAAVWHHLKERAHGQTGTGPAMATATVNAARAYRQALKALAMHLDHSNIGPSSIFPSVDDHEEADSVASILAFLLQRQHDLRGRMRVDSCVHPYLTETVELSANRADRILALFEDLAQPQGAACAWSVRNHPDLDELIADRVADLLLLARAAGIDRENLLKLAGALVESDLQLADGGQVLIA